MDSCKEMQPLKTDFEKLISAPLQVVLDRRDIKEAELRLSILLKIVRDLRAKIDDMVRYQTISPSE